MDALSYFSFGVQGLSLFIAISCAQLLYRSYLRMVRALEELKLVKQSAQRAGVYLDPKDDPVIKVRRNLFWVWVSIAVMNLISQTYVACVAMVLLAYIDNRYHRKTIELIKRHNLRYET